MILRRYPGLQGSPPGSIPTSARAAVLGICLSPMGTCSKMAASPARVNLTSKARVVARGTMLSSGAFDPDAVKAMTAAYEGTCTALDLADRTDPLTEIIAKKIIERAKRGELDPVRLCEAVLDDLRSKS